MLIKSFSALFFEPVFGEPGRDLLQGKLAGFLVDELLQGAPEIESIGSGREKGRPVGGVLNGVGKGEKLFVVVKNRGINLAYGYTRKNSAAWSRQRQCLLAVAKRQLWVPRTFSSFFILVFTMRTGTIRSFLPQTGQAQI